MLKRHFLMMARYNEWANARLYEAAADLSDDEFRRDVGVFFRSMQGTLNHLLAADRIWMKRFSGEGEAPVSLDAMLHPALPALKLARQAEDQRIVHWLRDAPDKKLAGRFSYMTISDMRTVSQNLAPALHHFFNHQTHHRGQAHAVLTMLGRPSLVLDLITFQRTDEGREFA